MKTPQDTKLLLQQATLTAEDIRALEPPVVPFVVQPWLIKGQYHLLTAYQGFQKSYFSLWLAKQAALQGEHVLFVDLENDKGTIIRRFNQLDVPPVANLQYWGDWRGLEEGLRPPAKLHATYLQIAEQLRPIMIFDSMNRFHDFEENSASEMKRVTGFFGELVKRGATVWMIHQSGKPKEDGRYDSRGSSEIGAGVHLHWQIEQFNNLGTERAPQNLLLMRCPKAREFPSFSTNIIFDSKLGNFQRVPGEFAAQEHKAKAMFRLVALRDEIIQNPGLTASDLSTNIKAHGLTGLGDTYLRQLLSKADGVWWHYETGPHGQRFYHPLDKAWTMYPWKLCP